MLPLFHTLLHISFHMSCSVMADATKLSVSPLNPRVPRTHVLTLLCASQCDAHLRDSLQLSWTRDGEALGDNGTDDGR